MDRVVSEKLGMERRLLGNGAGLAAISDIIIPPKCRILVVICHLRERGEWEGIPWLSRVLFDCHSHIQRQTAATTRILQATHVDLSADPNLVSAVH